MTIEISRRAAMLGTAGVVTAVAASKVIAAPSGKPNIIVIMGDDIGLSNVSAYGRGVVGYRTPNIDRLANEGALLTDYYGQQSCTAGRSAFITGQVPFRTGLSKVGLPGAPQGIQKEDPTIAELLKPLGYATGQFGKNHLGDLDEHLPTMHGFDEFFGNLYHLQAHQEPEHEQYPKDPQFMKRWGPRGVLHSWANPDGTQRVEDTGPLSTKRMETIDEEVLTKAIDWLDRTKASGKPFFLWYNTTRMHATTHIRPENRKTDLGFYADGMIEHDGVVGKLLDYLDKTGLTNNSIVIYTGDNGPMVCEWPDAGSTPFRGEKGTNWEGGWRVPMLVRWPGVIKPGTVINDIMSGEDWLPTFLSAAGSPDIKQQLLNGMTIGSRTYKVHLDGYDQTALLAGKAPSARKEFFYFSDDGDLLALRYGNYKAHFMIQEATGYDVWRTPFTKLRAPILFDLRSDSSERGMEGLGHEAWQEQRGYWSVPVQNMIGGFLATFRAFPPRQKPGSFTVQQASDALAAPKVSP